MGTRSLTRFITQHGDEKVTITCVYRQYDGYPSSHGKELADFLCSGKMVNGFGQSEERQFNGIGCLAGQFIAEFKNGVGGIYIHHPDSKDCGEEYVYEVIYKSSDKIFEQPKEDSLIMTCYDVYAEKTIFEGLPKDFHTILETA
jgi:hypothetical protein